MIPLDGVADGVDDLVRPALAFADVAQGRMLAVEVVRLEDGEVAGPSLGEILGQPLVELRRRDEAREVVGETVDDVDVADARRIVEQELRREVQDAGLVRLLQHRPGETRLLELDRQRGRDLVGREMALLVSGARLRIEDVEVAVVVGIRDRATRRRRQRIDVVREALAELG